jgi:hypothetical protein
MPAAGAAARGIQPTSPWYAYDAALRNAQHERQDQTHTIFNVKKKTATVALSANHFQVARDSL